MYRNMLMRMVIFTLFYLFGIIILVIFGNFRALTQQFVHLILQPYIKVWLRKWSICVLIQ